MKFVPKETQNLNIVAAILNSTASTQQPGHVFMASFFLRDFVHIASEEPFNYHSVSWLLLSHIIFSQICSKLRNDSIEDSEVDNYLEKIDSADLVSRTEGSQLKVFSLLQISSRIKWHHINMAWLPIQLQNGSLWGRFFQDECHQDMGTSVSGKTECLLAIGQDKKGKLYEGTFSFKNRNFEQSLS